MRSWSSALSSPLGPVGPVEFALLNDLHLHASWVGSVQCRSYCATSHSGRRGTRWSTRWSTAVVDVSVRSVMPWWSLSKARVMWKNPRKKKKQGKPKPTGNLSIHTRCVRSLTPACANIPAVRVFFKIKNIISTRRHPAQPVSVLSIEYPILRRCKLCGHKKYATEMLFFVTKLCSMQYTE